MHLGLERGKQVTRRGDGLSYSAQAEKFIDLRPHHN